jgi:hypothetical protein
MNVSWEVGSTDGSWMSFIEVLDSVFRMDIFGRFPTVMCLRESFPPDKVLELVPSLPDL